MTSRVGPIIIHWRRTDVVDVDPIGPTVTDYRYNVWCLLGHVLLYSPQCSNL